MIKDIFKTGIFLLVVASISGVLLAFTEGITSPIIKENQLKAELEAQRYVLPSNQYSDEISSEKNGLKAIYRVGFDEQGNVTGAVFKVSPKGFGGNINTMVGINKEGKVINYKILSLSETPGLGNKLTSDDFSNRFRALLATSSPIIFKVKKDGGNVDAITAATISSRAFCTGIREALDLFNTFKDEILIAKKTSNQTENTKGGTKE